MLCLHAHRDTHTRLHRIRDPRHDPARERARRHQPRPGVPQLCGAKPVYVPMAAGAELDLDRLGAAFSRRTRAIIVCTPNNPTGRVLSRRELEAIADLCRRHDAYAVTDEIYEHIYYEGRHIPIATLDGMQERTITISGASKN